MYQLKAGSTQVDGGTDLLTKFNKYRDYVAKIDMLKWIYVTAYESN